MLEMKFKTCVKQRKKLCFTYYDRYVSNRRQEYNFVLIHSIITLTSYRRLATFEFCEIFHEFINFWPNGSVL
jgi:hypothetical protein